MEIQAWNLVALVLVVLDQDALGADRIEVEATGAVGIRKELGADFVSSEARRAKEFRSDGVGAVVRVARAENAGECGTSFD